MPSYTPPTIDEFTALVFHDYDAAQAAFPQEPLALRALTTFRTSLTTAHSLRAAATELDWHAFDIFADMKTCGLGSRIEDLINSRRPPLGSRLNPIIINDEPTPTPDPNDHPNTIPIPRRTIRYAPYPKQHAHKTTGGRLIKRRPSTPDSPEL
ncbi:hypothetical protein CPB84DRAFT_1749861 [Gymnopilus junonius]|uniref:Uncharacterized protein n=1 Tax=Gymnopilus junonius TaxID=109634 RepID=A0A9P5NJD6_GYMJU|nr:hypothetical protein CPB84DRAFT_1749861 [Gymnopilus junonius]